MKKYIVLLLVIVFVILTNISVFACAFDTDCSPGSKCIKPAGSLYGVCAGGLFPGNSNDQTPVYDPMDLSEKVGDTCSFNLDCGIGYICFKTGGSIYGVCVPSR